MNIEYHIYFNMRPRAHSRQDHSKAHQLAGNAAWPDVTSAQTGMTSVFEGQVLMVLLGAEVMGGMCLLDILSAERARAR